LAFAATTEGATGAATASSAGSKTSRCRAWRSDAEKRGKRNKGQKPVHDDEKLRGMRCTSERGGRPGSTCPKRPPEEGREQNQQGADGPYQPLRHEILDLFLASLPLASAPTPSCTREA